jgi:cytochrome b involved in lipid metabolism
MEFINKIYIKIDDHWFDVTNYRDHPGSYSILKKYHLKDASEEFNRVKGHSDGYANGLLDEFLIKDKELVKKIEMLCKKIELK